MSEMCINSIFQRFFPILLVKKIICPVYYLRFPDPGQILLKKNTHIPLFGYAQKKCRIGGRLVSWLVSLYVCLSVGLLLVILVFFLYIIFIGNLDY